MKFCKTILPLCLVLILATSAWAAPQGWGVFVTTGAEYLYTRAGAIGIEHGCWDCNGYDRSGINQFNWYCCGACLYCPGFLCTDESAFDAYQQIGDFYDCEGNLLEAGSPWDMWLIIRGTGTIFDGGIGGGEGNGYVVDCQPFWCSPARDCRIFADSSPKLSSCPNGYPFIPSPNPGKNLGKPRKGLCELPSPLVANPINVTTGNKYEEALDLKVFTPGVPLELKRSYNSQSTYEGPLGYGWTHNYNLWIEVVEKKPLKRVTLWDEDGRALHFYEVKKGADSDVISFVGESGVRDKLTKHLATGQYILRRKENLIYRFNSKGKLIEISDRSGNRLTLTYEDGTLSNVASNFGRSFRFKYKEGHIEWIKDPSDRTVVYGYQGGDLVKVNYPDGNSIGYDYLNHNLTNKYDTDGTLIGHWEYDEKDRARAYYSHLKDGDTEQPQNRIDLEYYYLKTEVIRPSGATTYTYQMKDDLNLITEIEGCSGCKGLHKRFEYSPRLDLISVTSIVNGKEITTKYDYDDPEIPWEQLGEVVQKTEALDLPEERITKYLYTQDSSHPIWTAKIEETKTSVLVPKKNTTLTHKYDLDGNLSFTEKTGYTVLKGKPTLKTYRTSYTYNSLNQPIKVNGPRSDIPDVTKYEYYKNAAEEGNNRGQLMAIVNALGHTTSFSDYDANGNVGKITDPNGVATLFTYDERNRVRIITNLASGAATQYLYNPHGNLATVIFPEKNRIDLTYNPADQITDIKDSLGNTIHYDYDKEGNRAREEVKEVKDLKEVVRRYLDFTHYSDNRLKRITNPDTTFTDYTYDENGNRTIIQDPRTNQTSYTYDALNRLVKMTQIVNPDNRNEDIITEYQYDPHDNLTSIKDGNRNVTQYTFDDFGRLVQTFSPDTATTKYEYDRAGNLVEKTDAEGTVITYTYDALKRLTAVKSPDPSQNIINTYDSTQVTYGIGKLTGRTDPSGTYTFHYDPHGKQIKEEKRIGNVTYTTQYGYNKNGTQTSIIYPSGRSAFYGMNEAGRVSEVTASLNNQNQRLSLGITYLPFGGINGFTYGNGLPLSQGYDLQYRMDSIEAGSILKRAYTPDPNGNITDIRDTVELGGNKAFVYDPLNRLVFARHAAGEINYTYDPVGNRLSQTNGQKTDYSYIRGTNLLGVIRSETITRVSHDKNGNMNSENGTTFFYDPFGRLDTVWEGGKKLAEYVYDGNGQRVKKITPEGGRIFHYDLRGHLIAESNENGETQAEYIYLGDRLLAMILPGERVYYFHNDHLGSPQVLTDQTGEVVWKADYRPFGEIQVLIEKVENPFRFPGQYYDKETGLHYNHLRYYYPGIGRYLTPDPVGLRGGINPYTYGMNNPFRLIDPHGLWGWADMPVPPGYLSDFFAAFGATLTMGGTDWIRSLWQDAFGLPDLVNRCSTSYRAGNIAGQVWEGLALSTMAWGLAGLPMESLSVFTNPYPFWHLGLQFEGELSLIHVGLAPYGYHLAIYFVAYQKAWLHFYIDPWYPFSIKVFVP